MLDLLHKIEREISGDPEEVSEAERLAALESRRSFLRMLQALALVVVLLLFFSSERLVRWVNGFEVGPVQDAIVSVSTDWHSLMADAGFTAAAETVRAELDELHGADWSELRRRIERERARTRDGVRLLRGAVPDAKS
ncbi:hypothetical protein [Parvibaculum sp.]|jgi:hypothetical protein|uniref:hypothetical protein n=1 Tax=Parvibaculum sp. TaxID=2024848 RepID=UPI00329A7ED3